MSERWKSSGGEASITPVMPPITNVTRKPRANSIGGSNAVEPPHIVPIQLKNFTPVGTAISNDVAAKNGSDDRPVANMWCAHTDVDSARDGERASIERPVAEHRLAREHREDLGDHAEERQDQDVHLGVAEEPEQVLPQDRRRRPSVGSKKCGAELAVGEQHHQRRGQHREREQHQELVTSMFHVKIGMRNIVMPGARIVVDRGDDVDRAERCPTCR